MLGKTKSTPSMKRLSFSRAMNARMINEMNRCMCRVLRGQYSFLHIHRQRVNYSMAGFCLFVFLAEFLELILVT